MNLWIIYDPICDHCCFFFEIVLVYYLARCRTIPINRLMKRAPRKASNKRTAIPPQSFSLRIEIPINPIRKRTAANTKKIKTAHSILIGIGTFLLFDSPIVPSITKLNTASINSSIMTPRLHSFYGFIIQGRVKVIAK